MIMIIFTCSAVTQWSISQREAAPSKLSTSFQRRELGVNEDDMNERWDDFWDSFIKYGSWVFVASFLLSTVLGTR